MNGFLLKADDLGKTDTGKDLDVEYFLDGSLKFKQTDEAPTAHVHRRHAAFQLAAPFSDGHTVHCGGRPYFRKADEGMGTRKRPAPGEAGKLRNCFSASRLTINERDAAGA